MTTKGCDGRVAQQKAIRTLLEKARASSGDRRESERFPFFQPVTITAEHDRPVSLSAFSRDISECGMGLLLYWPLKRGAAHMIIHLSETDEISVAGEVCWCHPCGQGWYTAGIRFSDAH